MSALFSSGLSDEYLNEQLFNCLNNQTSMIHQITQYSHVIRMQLGDIKNNVEFLANKVASIQQHHNLLQLRQHESFVSPFAQIRTPQAPPFIPNSLLSFRPPYPMPLYDNRCDLTTTSAPSPSLPLSFARKADELPSPSTPYVFNDIQATTNIYTLDHDDDDECDSYEPSDTFKRLVYLSPTETKTGEEDENILFCERAKLYRFDPSTNEMKERGLGEMKILQHKKTHLCRVLMRREQVFKVCANHRITSEMELKEHQGKENAYIWSAMDYSDGPAKHETLCVRFKTDEQGKRFVKIFQEGKAFNEKQTVDSSPIDNIRLSDDDVTVIGEIKPTKEQIDRAKRLQLPLTFYLYENKEPCKGCRGCREDSPSILSNEVQHDDQLDQYRAMALLEQLRSFPSAFFPNSSLQSLMSLVPSWLPESPDSRPILNMPSPPKDHRTFIKAKRSLPSNRVPPLPTILVKPSSYEQSSSGAEEVAVVQTHQKKSRNFSGTNIQSYSLDNYASQLTENILDRVKQDLAKQLQIVKTKDDATLKSQSDKTMPSIFSHLTLTKPDLSSFSFANLDSSSKTSTGGFQFSQPTSITNTTPPPLFAFGNVPKVSFAQVAQQSSDKQWTTSSADRRVFPGQSVPLFSTKTNENDDDEEGGADDSYEPSGTFKRLVYLLPVETKTGEEDENILFCERAKLYRFDPSTNEMKERGLGEMKILEHKKTHLCRVLMRREQVFKVCANHRCQIKIFS
ncbi:unnamed protein product [Adineta ricciae]|uniref:RanBD1 domain-containing protein n=1 Tax=Adineta ricciae TaxID=249248 RepID=A0A814HJF1_ADIRI|nr:unnamed protein product [Adineta ricciae]